MFVYHGWKCLRNHLFFDHLWKYNCYGSFLGGKKIIYINYCKIFKELIISVYYVMYVKKKIK